MKSIFTIDDEFFERRRANDFAASFFSATLSTRCMTTLNKIEVNLIQSSKKTRKYYLIKIQLYALHGPLVSHE